MAGVLPWYDRLDKQEYQKPYAHGAVPIIASEINFIPPFQLVRPKTGALLTRFGLVNFKTGTETDILTTAQAAGLEILEPDGKNYEIIMYPSTVRLGIADFDKGGYYIIMEDGTNTWYSEVFTMMDNITSSFIKLEWCHHRNFEYFGGHTQFTEDDGTGNGYKNYIWLNTHVVKPAYLYEREVVPRDGKVFPRKQILTKGNRFEFIGPESMIDVLSRIELHDVIRVYDNYGDAHEIDQFEMAEPRWFSQGNIAAVTFEFIPEDGVISVYGNGLGLGTTCEVTPGTCVSLFDSVITKANVVEDSALWVAGQYYNSDGVLTDLVAGEYIVSGDPDSYSLKVYLFNAPDDYTEQVYGDYTVAYVETEEQYYYFDAAFPARNFIYPRIGGFTDLTTPDTFYGRAMNITTQLWLEDDGGSQVFVRETSDSALNIGEQIDHAGYTYLVLKTVTVKCGVIDEFKYLIPASYVIITNADDDFTTAVSNADGDLTTVVGSGDIPSITVP